MATATEQLKAWEDEHLGPNTPRVDGKIEKGHGSAYEDLSDADKAAHTALEKLIVAEDGVAKAQADLAVAQAAFDAANLAANPPPPVEVEPPGAMAASAEEEESDGRSQHAGRRRR